MTETAISEWTKNEIFLSGLHAVHYVSQILVDCKLLLPAYLSRLSARINDRGSSDLRHGEARSDDKKGCMIK